MDSLQLDQQVKVCTDRQNLYLIQILICATTERMKGWLGCVSGFWKVGAATSPQCLIQFTPKRIWHTHVRVWTPLALVQDAVLPRTCVMLHSCSHELRLKSNKVCVWRGEAQETVPRFACCEHHAT